jgi:hypothetical protein
MVLKEHKDLEDCKVHKVQMVCKGHMDHWGHKDLKEHKGLEDYKG